MANVLYAMLGRPTADGSVLIVADFQSDRLREQLNPSDLKSALANAPLHFSAKTTFSTEKYLYHVSTVEGQPCSLIYAIVAETAVSRTDAYNLLDQLHSSVINESALLMRIPVCKERSLTAEIAPKIAAVVMEFNGEAKENSARIAQLREQVSEVTQTMSYNVEQVIQRGERLNDLQDRCEGLESSAHGFKWRAVTLQRRMCCQNFKWTIIGSSVGLTVLLVIILIILWQAGVFK